MFNWLGNIFPYSDLHSLNLDWILTKMKETAAQAAKAIADSANALAQVIEAKTAAQDAQTAAQNAQTAANNAQTAADNAATSAENAVTVAQAAKSAAQTAQNTADAAKSAAQTAQNTAQTAQSAAQTAQSAAETAQNTANTAQSAAQTAQSAAQTANDSVETLSAKFPIKSADIASQAITPGKLTTDFSKIWITDKFPTSVKFPKSGNANINQITDGIVLDKGRRYDYTSPSEFLQFKMDIIENGSNTPNTIFRCVMSPVTYTKGADTRLIAISPFIVIKEETNETYNGFIKMYMTESPNTTTLTCKAVFATTPPFNDNTGFVIKVGALSGQLNINA